jgi:mannose-6-phosphate isomerase-like protein (cupin superfamily)
VPARRPKTSDLQPIAFMPYQAINLESKLQMLTERWQPRVIAEMNDYQFKVVKLEGDFVWHRHEDTDETFIVLSGDLRIDFRDGAVSVAAGELYVVPKGVEHKPFAENEVQLLLIEPRGVLNTGSAGGKRPRRTISGSDALGSRRRIRPFTGCVRGR